MNKINKKANLSLLVMVGLLFISQFSVAQGIVTGTVTSLDDEAGIPGVNVLIKGSNSGSVTDVDGKYSVKVPGSESILVFSSIGYISQEVVVGNRTVIDLVLDPDNRVLDEIVVIGYGTAKKSDLTGALSSLETDQMKNQVLTGLAEGLQGQAAGVHVSQQSGAPGRDINVVIRGVSTLSASSAPLYVIDGVPIANGLSQINPNDISSIEILKDASSTAIYGSRGANGVVLITTKSGGGKVSSGVDFSTYYGVSKATNIINMANGPQYAEMINEREINSGNAPIFTQQEVDNMPTYDWQNIVLQNAPVQNYDFSTFGSSDKTTYNVMMNYFDQTGIIKGSGFSRGSLRLNLNSDVSNKFNISSNMMIGVSRRDITPDGGQTGGLLNAQAMIPFMPPRDADGEYTIPSEFFPEASINFPNPLAALEQVDNNSTSTRILGNVSMRYNFIEDLSLTVLLGVDNQTTEGNFYDPTTNPGSLGTALVDKRFNQFYTNQNILNYKKDLGDHNLDVTGLFEWTYAKTSSLRAGGSGFFTDALGYNLIDLAENQNPASTSAGTESSIASYMGRINYGFKDKYLITVSARMDGSSKFGVDNKWAMFPSAAFAWRMSNEPFIQNLGVFSNLKLRLSWGKTGNQNFASYQSLATFGTLTSLFGETPSVALRANNLANNELKWETSISTNLGLDFGFLEDRFMFTAEYYSKTTEDLLAFVPLSPSTGFTSIVQNIGSIRNQGFEFAADVQIIEGGFRWGVNANISYNKNEVLELAGGSDIFGDALEQQMGQMNIIREGYPLGAFWTFRESGYDENGAITYVDTNQDGTINDADKEILGDPGPDVFYGITNKFSWKGFNLSMFLQGVAGAQVINSTSFFSIEGMYRGANPSLDYYNNRWKKDGSNPNPAYGALFTSRNNMESGSDRFIEDASYIRLKNIRLSYDLPIQKISWLRNTQVFVSADNLVTITDYTGYDPEVSVYNGGSVTSRTRLGVDQGAYPTSKTYIVGVKFGF